MKPIRSHSIPTPRVPQRRLCEVHEVTERPAEISELAEKLADEYTVLLRRLAALQKQEQGIVDEEAGVDLPSALPPDAGLGAIVAKALEGSEDAHSGVLSLFPPEPEGEEEVTGRYSLKGKREVVRVERKT
jgi:hypothetical protein